MLTVSSEMKEGKRAKTMTLEKDNSNGLIANRDTVEPESASGHRNSCYVVKQEVYFSQRYQAIAMDYSINCCSIVEIEVKFISEEIPGGFFSSATLDPFNIVDFEISPVGYKRIMLDIPNDTYISLYPLFR